MTSDVSIGMELVAENAVEKWRTAMGPTNTQTAQSEAPSSMRALFGTDGCKNATHGSHKTGAYKYEAGYWFGDAVAPEKRPMQTTAVLNNCSLCIIKPHILREG